jgi:O-methyltransferase involved in polyketide biosynthesis
VAVGDARKLFDKIIADAVGQHGVDLVLNLAAGLDTRPYG